MFKPDKYSVNSLDRFVGFLPHFWGKVILFYQRLVLFKKKHSETKTG